MLRTLSPNANKKHRPVLLATDPMYNTVSPAIDTMLTNVGKIFVERRES